MPGGGLLTWNELAKWAYQEILGMITIPEGGVGIVQEIGGVESVENERVENAAKLAALCQAGVSNPLWIAHDITGDGKAETFCNRNTRFIAGGMGYAGFGDTMSANQMIRHMAAHPEEWREEHDLERCAKEAQRGALVILGAEEIPNGHVTACAPLPAEDSGSWGRKVPMVAHVGGGKTPNGVVKASAAFKLSQMPRLRAFILEASIA